jgi:hypothetical protein
MKHSKLTINNAHLEKAHNVAYVILKAQINHPISLIHAQKLAVVKCEFSLL